MEQKPKKRVKLITVDDAVEQNCSMEKQPKNSVKLITEDCSILSVNNWKNTKAFKSIKNTDSQMDYYTRMNSSPDVLTLVGLDSKRFGSQSETIIQEIFMLGPRTSSQNDGTRNCSKIEIKCARYWAGKDCCKWQHLEKDHDYDIAMFVLLDFHGWKVWCIKKTVLMSEELQLHKIVTSQGKQGYWTTKSLIEPYLTTIMSIAELDAFIQS